MSAIPYLPQIISALEASRYFLLFAGAYIEGTAVMMTGGFLWHEGIVNFFPAYFSLMAGDFLSDCMWYFIGYWGGEKFINRWGYLLNATPKLMEKARHRFHEYHTGILIFSKLTMGFGLAVPILMTAGMMRVSFLRYVVINVLGSFVWIAFVMTVGYYFGNVLALIPTQYQIAFTGGALILLVLALRYINQRLARADW